jgi:hypothetical protein
LLFSFSSFLYADAHFFLIYLHVFKAIQPFFEAGSNKENPECLDYAVLIMHQFMLLSDNACTSEC